MTTEELDSLKSDRKMQLKALDAVIDAAARMNRNLTPTEAARFNALDARIKKIDGQLAAHDRTQAALAKRAARAAAATDRSATKTGGIRIKREQMTYSPFTPGRSYFKDLIGVQVPNSNIVDKDAAATRLARHRRELEVESRKRPDLRWALAEEQRATDSVSGYGGDLIAPLYLIDQAVPYFRAGRAAANRCTNLPLPAKTNSISVPKITAGGLVSPFAAPTGGTLPSITPADLTTSTVTAQVNTLAGMTDVSLQLIEQSSINIDELIFADLTASYDQQLDTAILTGSGTGGQHLGILTYVAAGNGNVIYTGAATTAFMAAGGLYPSIVKATSAIESTRFASPTGIWVHPRRANSFAIQTDGTAARPLFTKYGPMNAIGSPDATPTFEGVAGEIYGMAVVKDANTPTAWASTTTTLAASAGTQDVIIVLKEDDLYLWESPLRLRALPEVSSGSLAVRLQAYAYSAFLPSRAPAGISVITGPALNLANIGW